MIKKGWLPILALLVFSCRKNYDAPVPDLSWPIFDSPSAKPLPARTRNKLEGVYSITDGGDVFGGQAALKWSYTVNGRDTIYHLSMFCAKQVIYIICEGKQLDTSILLNGYWRD